MQQVAFRKLSADQGEYDQNDCDNSYDREEATHRFEDRNQRTVDSEGPSPGHGRCPRLDSNLRTRLRRPVLYPGDQLWSGPVCGSRRLFWGLACNLVDAAVVDVGFGIQGSVDRPMCFGRRVAHRVLCHFAEVLAGQ